MHACLFFSNALFCRKRVARLLPKKSLTKKVSRTKKWIYILLKENRGELTWYLCRFRCIVTGNNGFYFWRGRRFFYDINDRLGLNRNYFLRNACSLQNFSGTIEA